MNNHFSTPVNPAFESITNSCSSVQNSENKSMKLFQIEGIYYFSHAQYELAQYACKTGDYTAFGQILQAESWKQCTDIMQRYLDRKSQVAVNESSDLQPTVYVNLIPIKKMASGNQKKRYGIRIETGNRTCQLYFGCKEQTFLYIATLLYGKAGLTLKRKVFEHSLNASSAEAKKELAWLEELYHILFPYASLDFKDWYPKLKDKSMHAVSQAKSQVNTKLKKALDGFSSSTLEPLLVQTEKRAAAKADYRIALASIHITLDATLQPMIPSHP